MTLRNRIIKLAQDVPETRKFLVPILRLAQRDSFEPFSTGKIWDISDFIHGRIKVEILGYERHFSNRGPDMFTTFYKVRAIETGEEFLLHPRYLHLNIKWDVRGDYADAFNLVTKALRAGGLLKVLKRKASPQRNQLGYEVPHGSPAVETADVDKALMKLDDAHKNGDRISFTVPTGDTDTKVHTVHVQGSSQGTLYRLVII